MTRGFITIATGNENYYKTAANLLLSYKFFTENPLHFTILCDRENKYTKLFDNTIILENPHRTYLDKIELLNNIPYDETIFVESDCLAYADMNLFFDAFNGCDDFSIFGRSLPLDTKENCWFNIEETGKYREFITFKQRFHSAIIYLRKTDTCKKIYKVCKDVDNNFNLYNIGGDREALDDKLFAIGSAVMQCKMTNKSPDGYANNCYYPHEKNIKKHPKPQMRKQCCTFFNYKNEKVKAIICHWNNGNTRRILYKREIVSLRYLIDKKFYFKIKELLLTILYPFSEFKKSIYVFFWKIILWKPIKKCLMPFKKLLKKKLLNKQKTLRITILRYVAFFVRFLVNEFYNRYFCGITFARS